MEPVTHTVIDRKQSNDRGCKSLVQQSLEYRPWLRGWRPQSHPQPPQTAGRLGLLSLHSSIRGSSMDSCRGLQLGQWQPVGTRTFC